MDKPIPQIIASDVLASATGSFVVEGFVLSVTGFFGVFVVVVVVSVVVEVVVVEVVELVELQQQID
jgi:hypothetical protein